MRFNNRACALMDIPDLPQSAFEHIGDRKIKPQGGGGGGISNGFGLGEALASIDPSPAIGSGLASVDKAVNEIPGGWYTVGGLAAGGTAIAFAPEIAAAIGAEAGTEITTAAGQQAFFDTLAAGGTGAEAASAGLAADTALTSAVAPVTDLSAPWTSSAPVTDLSVPWTSETILPGELGNIIYDAEGNMVLSSGSDILPAASGLNITPMQAILGARAATGLLGGGGLFGNKQQQTPQMLQAGAARSQMPQGAVDYSGLYNLLALQKARNPNSLLG